MGHTCMHITNTHTSRTRQPSHHRAAHRRGVACEVRKKFALRVLVCVSCQFVVVYKNNPRHPSHNTQ